MVTFAEQAALAATRAALDPARAQWQNDILISAIVELLARKAPLNEDELINELRNSWVTAEIPRPSLLEAIEAAERNDLVLRQERSGVQATFDVTPNARVEAEADAQWAQMLQRRFEEDVCERLTAELGRDVAGRPMSERAPLMAQMLLRAMVQATQDLFLAAKGAASSGNLSEVRVNLRSAVPSLRDNIQPEILGQAVSNLLLAAANPSDPFGDEMLKMIGTGQMLHGMVCRRDIEVLVPPAHLLLDTSELVNLVNEDHVQRELFFEFLAAAKQLGAVFIVPDMVWAEWKSLWDEADSDEEGTMARAGSAGTSMLLSNPFLRAFMRAQEEDPSLEWRRWSKRRRDLGWLLGEAGVSFEVRGAPADIDPALVTGIVTGLRARNAEGRRLRKSARLAETDATSAAWVDLLRRRQPSELIVPAAWFVAADTTTRRVYSELRPREVYPLSITSSLWMLRYSAHFIASKEREVRLAERIAETAVMNSFVSVISSFTAEDVYQIEQLLADGASNEDLEDAIRSAFWDAPSSATGDHVADFSRRRARRRDARARRDAELVEERTRAANAELGSAKTKLDTEAGAHHATQRELDRHRRTIRRYKRGAASIVVALFLGSAVVLVARFGGLPWQVNLVIAVLVGVTVILQSYRFIRHLDVTASALVHEVWLAAVGIGAPFLITAFLKR